MAPSGVSYPIAPPPSAFAPPPASAPSTLPTQSAYQTTIPSSASPPSFLTASTAAQSPSSQSSTLDASTSSSNNVTFPVIIVICLIILTLLYIAMIVAVIWGRVRGSTCPHCQRLEQKLKRTEERLELCEMQGRQVPGGHDGSGGDDWPPPPPLPPTPPEDLYSANSVEAGPSFPQAPRPAMMRQKDSASSTGTRLSKFHEHLEKDVEAGTGYEDIELGNVKLEPVDRRDTFENISLTSRGGDRYGAEPTPLGRRFETYDMTGGFHDRQSAVSSYYGDEARESRGPYGAGQVPWQEVNDRGSGERSGVLRRPGEYT